MAKLILSMDNLMLKEISLTKERTTIGRKPQNDIQIDNLAISGEHAAIVTILNDAFLEDLGSTNGTQVNGQPIKKHFLQNGDVIELGKYRLKYVNEAQPQVSQADFERTMIIRPDMAQKLADQSNEKAPMGDTQTGMSTNHFSPPPSHLATEPATPPAPSPQAPPSVLQPAVSLRGAIQVLTGVNAGKELELTKTLTSLGKPGVQVAVITRRPHGYFITHVEGAVFPSVNGKLLDAQAHPLGDHDIIELAGTKMEFFLKS
ncbi:MAG: FHA domain-containing protein [Sterolibacterium sp.]|nr:FHA domain-containing protein [Sterolibacterium sp.]